MAIDFNGDTLTITLESGITELDIVGDLYKDWKDWMLSNPRNRRYPQALTSDGGNPLTAVLNQGSYIFLNNTAGWRIKPPEEDITITVTGNLALADIDLPSIIPTTGGFTVALLGLQPITQGVVPSMRTQSDYNAFNSGVTLDPQNLSGGAIPGTTHPAGTEQFPSNNHTDTLAIAVANGFDTIYVRGDVALTSGDWSVGYDFHGTNPLVSSIVISDAANVDDCEFQGLTVSGTIDDNNVIRTCRVFNVLSLDGFILDSGLGGTVTLGGTQSTLITNCFSATAGASAPTVDCDGTTSALIVRGHNGPLELINKTNATGDIHFNSNTGNLIIDSSCTAGNVFASGVGRVVDENGVQLYSGVINGGLTLVAEMVYGEHLDDLWIGQERTIWIDTEAVAVGIGSQGEPFNTLTAGIDYAETVGITTLHVVSDITLDRNLKNFSIVGDGDPTVDTAGFDLTNSSFSRCRIEGTYVGAISVQESILLNGFYMNGFFSRCAISGSIFCIDGASVFMSNCSSAIPGPTGPTISMDGTGPTTLSVRGHNGGLTIKDCTNAGDTLTAEIARGSLTFDASNVAGTMVARTSGKFVDATAGATVIAEVYSQDMWGSMDLDTLPNDKIADMVFKKPKADFTDSSTIGGYLAKQVLTIGRFLGLK